MAILTLETSVNAIERELSSAVMVLLVKVWVPVKVPTVPVLPPIGCAVPSDVTVITVPSVNVCDVPVKSFNDVIATTAGRLATLGGMPAPLDVNTCPALPVATAVGLSVESDAIRLPAVPVASFAFDIALFEMVCTPALVIVAFPDSVWFFHTESELS